VVDLSGLYGLNLLRSWSLRRRAGLLFDCCASTRWAATVAARLDECRDDSQFYGLIDDVWWCLSPGDWQEAIDANPRPAVPDVAGPAPTLLREIAEGLRAYEERFAMRYVARGHGRGAAELLLVLRRRLANPASVELRIAAGEQIEITKTRLLGALGAVPAPDHGRHQLRLRAAAPRGALAY
jgi:hypothetical protein